MHLIYSALFNGYFCGTILDIFLTFDRNVSHVLGRLILDNFAYVMSAEHLTLTEHVNG